MLLIRFRYRFSAQLIDQDVEALRETLELYNQQKNIYRRPFGSDSFLF